MYLKAICVPMIEDYLDPKSFSTGHLIQLQELWVLFENVQK